MVYGLPDRLKALRQQHGLTQKELAEILGVSPSSISSYETGSRSPSIEKLTRIAALYRCGEDYLLGTSDLPPATMLNIDGLSEPQIRALQHLIELFKEKNRS